MTDNHATAVLWRRLPYMLSPQWDIYSHIWDRVEEKRVLEVGFGTGIGVLQYAGNAKDVLAIEIDKAAVGFAEKVFPLRNICWRVRDLLTFEGEKFDYIVMIEVLEHVVDSEKALERIHGLLVPGGKALITVPNKLRHRHKDEILIENEWTPPSFLVELLPYFHDAQLLDYELQPLELPNGDRATPIIAEVTRVP